MVDSTTVSVSGATSGNDITLTSISAHDLIDDFEDGSLSEWSGDTASISIASQRIEGNESLKFAGPTDGTTDTVSRSVAVDKYQNLTVYVNDSSAKDNYLNWSGPRSVGPRIAFKSGSVEFYNGSQWVDTGISVTQNTEYKVRLENIDYGTEQYDIVVTKAGGGSVGSYNKAPFAGNATRITTLAIENAGTTYYDFIGSGVAPSQSISGQVLDSAGNAVANATVRVVGIDYSNITTIEEKEALSKKEELKERATELVQEAENPTPGAWKPDRQLVGSGGLFQSVSEPYVAVYTLEDLGARPWVDSADLETPRLQVPAQQAFVLTAWDPNGDAGFGSQFGEFASQNPGAPLSDQAIVIEQIDPLNDTVHKQTVTPDQTFKGGAADLTSLPYARVRLQAGFYRVYPKGSPESSYVIAVGNVRDLAEAIEDDLKDRAGDLTEQAQSIRTKFDKHKFVSKTVETDANGRYSVTVGPAVDAVAIEAYKAPEGVDISDGSTHPLTQARTLVESGKISGAIYAQISVPQYDVPTTNADVEVVEVTSPQYTNISTATDRFERWRRNRENATRAAIQTALNQHWNETTKSKLQDLREQLGKLVDQNQELREKMKNKVSRDRVMKLLEEIKADKGPDRYKEVIKHVVERPDPTRQDLREYIAETNEDLYQKLKQNLSSSEEGNYSALLDRINSTDEPVTDTNGSKVALAEEISALKQTIAEQQGTIRGLEAVIASQNESIELLRQQQAAQQASLLELGSQVSALRQQISELDEPDNTTVTFPFAANLDANDTTVLVHYQNGSTDSLAADKWTVVERTGGGDAVVIENPPTGDGLVELEVVVANDQGEVGRSTATLRNTSKITTEPPDIAGFDYSTLAPGPSENVSVTIDPAADSTFSSVTSVTARGPNGQTIPVTRNGQTVYFVTDGPGMYTLEWAFNDSAGNVYHLTTRVTAGAANVPDAPTVMIGEGMTGMYALAGEGLDSASVEIGASASTLRVTALVPASAEAPDRIHVYAESWTSGTSPTITLQVLRGQELASASSLQQRSIVVLHLQAYPDDALMYRKTASSTSPLATGGTPKSGERVNNPGNTIVKSYTTTTGSLSVVIKENPALWESLIFDLRTASPIGNPLDALSMGLGIGISPAAGAGLLFLIRRRRRNGGRPVRRAAILLTAGLLITATIGAAPAAAAWGSSSPADQLTPIVGPNGHTSFIVEYTTGSLDELEHWANVSSDRTILSSHNASRTATIAAPRDLVSAGALELWLDSWGWGSSALEARPWITDVSVNYQLERTEPILALDNVSDYRAPTIGVLRIDDPTHPVEGMAFSGDAARTTMRESRTIVERDEVTANTSTIRFAIIDTGANTANGEIYGNGTPGSDLRIVNASKNFVTNETVDADGYDAIEDGNGHGSWVASAIGANTSNNVHDGIAPKAELLILKALTDDGSGSTSDIAAAIRYAADHDADVISMSLGSPLYSEALVDAINYAYDQGVSAIVLAAGNSRGLRSPGVASPADAPGVITVGATNGSAPSSAWSAYFSQYGGAQPTDGNVTNRERVDVAAPGMKTVARVASTEGSLENKTLSGTSMATPIVAGSVGVALAENTAWQGNETLVLEWVRKSARPIAHATPREVGHGMVSVANLVEKVEPAVTQADAMTAAAEARDDWQTARANAQGGLLPLLASRSEISGAVSVASVGSTSTGAIAA